MTTVQWDDPYDRPGMRDRLSDRCRVKWDRPCDLPERLVGVTSPARLSGFVRIASPMRPLVDSSVAVLDAVGDGGRRRAQVGRPHQREGVLGGALAVGGELGVRRRLHSDGFRLVAEHALDAVGYQHPQVAALRAGENTDRVSHGHCADGRSETRNMPLLRWI